MLLDVLNINHESSINICRPNECTWFKHVSFAEVGNVKKEKLLNNV